MRKKTFLNIITAALAVSAMVSGPITANAETTSTSWTVTYDGSSLTSDHDTSDAAKQISGTMPGDTITYSVTYTNASSKTADFYMASDIISTLEETSGSSASSGAYSYSISYDSGDGTVAIYDSATLGGDTSSNPELAVGLKQAAADDDNYFYVGELEPNTSGVVNVSVTLDGNTQDNSYMKTLAELGIYFGVEDASVTNNKVVYTLPNSQEIVYIKDNQIVLAGPQTGDSVLPLVLCGIALVAGIALVLYYVKLTKKEEEA